MKIKISYDLGFIAVGVMTPLRFLFIFVFLCTRSFFFLRNRLREYVPTIIVLIMAKFERILWESFGNILKQSFKNNKNGEIACYPH